VLTAALAGLLCALAVLSVSILLSFTIMSVHGAVVLAFPMLVCELLALAAWAALAAAVLGAWPGVACGLLLFVAARTWPGSPWLGWLPAPATTGAGAVEHARAALGFLGPWAVGAFVAGRD
jgi:hypothetical protein